MGNLLSNHATRQLEKEKDCHECAIFGRGSEAAESALQWETCEKNPGHRDFIPAEDFWVNHLPPGLWKKKFLDVYRSIAALTVRLRVNCVSRGRPDNDSLADYRGSDRFRTGTGFIAKLATGGDLAPSATHPLEEAALGGEQVPCPCRECGGKIVRKWFYVHVYTVSHVVYNTEEAKSTKVDLFYDDESCCEDGRMKSLWGFDVVQPNPERDSNVMRCISHDMTLAAQLLEDLSCATPTDHLTRNLTGIHVLLKDALVLIVSHPHGQAKKVTLGKVKGIVDGMTRVRWRSSKNLPPLHRRQFQTFTSWQYDAATCPGCSGAMVLIIDSLPCISGVMHSGGELRNKTNVNHSASGPKWGKFLEFQHGF